MSAEFSQEDLSLSKAATLSARSFMLVPSRLIASSGPILQSSHAASSVKTVSILFSAGGEDRGMAAGESLRSY